MSRDTEHVPATRGNSVGDARSREQLEDELPFASASFRDVDGVRQAATTAAAMPSARIERSLAEVRPEAISANPRRRVDQERGRATASKGASSPGLANRDTRPCMTQRFASAGKAAPVDVLARPR